MTRTNQTSTNDHGSTNEITFATRPRALYDDGPDARRAVIHHANAFMAHPHVQRHLFVTGPALDAEVVERIDALVSKGSTDDAALQAVDQVLRTTLSGQFQLIDERFEYADDILHDVRAQQFANIEHTRGRIAELSAELDRVQTRYAAFRRALLGLGMPAARLHRTGAPSAGLGGE